MNAETFCPVCGRVAILKKSWIMPDGDWGWDCSCASKAWDKEHLDFEEAIVTALKEKMKSRSSVLEVLPPVHRLNLQDPDMDRISKEIQFIAYHWADFKNTNIMMSGVSRTGKSFDLAWLMKAIYDQGFFSVADDFCWTTVKSMCEDICDSDNRIKFDFYQECRILVIDDIAVYGNEASMLFEVIDGRSNKMVDHPTWITTNLTPDKLETKFNHSALMNRIFQIDDETRKPKYKLILK